MQFLIKVSLKQLLEASIHVVDNIDKNTILVQSKVLLYNQEDFDKAISDFKELGIKVVRTEIKE